MAAPLRLALALLACALAGVASSVAAADSAALRLNGTFMQYQDEMLSWPPATWQSVLEQMKAARMNTVIIQMLARENADGSTHSFIGPADTPDATETILNWADTNQFRVFLGLYSPNWNHDMLGSDFLVQAQNKSTEVARQAWSRYLVGRNRPSFAGWYIPYEPWTANYQPAEITRLRAFLQGIDVGCREVAGDQPISISPFISAQRPPPCQVENLYSQLLSQSGIDILLLQDSVGAQQWSIDIPQKLFPYYRAFKAACDAAGVQLWANLESFQITNGAFVPCNIDRFRRQFEAAAPFVTTCVTFDFLHYMNPVAFLSGWDAQRRDTMRKLYADYTAGFVDHDYAPFAAPTVRFSLTSDHLALWWDGMEDDVFEMQFTTNLLASWTSLNVPIEAIGGRFGCTNRVFADHTASFYRVRKMPVLRPPESMSLISPGAFTMGTPTTDTNRTASELSPFEVSLTRGFWMGRFEVTQSEYQNLMCTNPAAFASDLNNPVDSISWVDATEYCRRLTVQERQAGRLPDGYLYRLPSEAEWEYAARAGSTNLFFFGDDSQELANYAWFSSNSGQRSHAVGKLRANAWSLHDTHGNVAEWCWDWIDTPPTSAVTNLLGAISGPYHAVRGGAWPFPARHARCGWRVSNASHIRQSYLGFRVVLAPLD